ncbi:Tol-Pal system protein TolB [Camellia lanceoleosa]|uniref:Tol-Pal system protein TolB n=1 Tax=Camellia lanceoleosa TaxID=1840588 RepID=A0ACC0HUT0_9ERIC|nr:Tol-Pal system protein TolB [Camellia lanceoleosa]
MAMAVAAKRGSIAFSATYRPPVPQNIFSRPHQPGSKEDEHVMTDGENYNYNGQEISSAALKTILKREKLASEGKESDVNSGRLTGMVFVSERQGGLELLHIALRYNDNPPPKPKVFCLADVFGKDNFSGVRMEDSGCIAGDNLIYVTTKDPAPKRRQPWTAVYKTNLKTGKTERLTPPGQADLNPSVAPSGMKIAVASFEKKLGGWDGEIDYLRTNIFMMSVGGWGSDNVIFFHRKVKAFWGVFRVDLNNRTSVRVTPDGIDAITPAAINATTVVVATMRQKYTKFSDVRVEAQYRHIEIFYSTGQQQNIRITQNTMPKADHFNPFVIDGGKRIGYHRCDSNHLKSGNDIQRNFHKLESPHPDVGLFTVPGIFPTFSKDGSKVAFVDNEFKAVWVAETAENKSPRNVYKSKDSLEIFSPVWNQNPNKNILYVSMGSSFHAEQPLNIFALDLSRVGCCVQLTNTSNNAFPSTNPEGTKLVFRSTRDGGNEKHKNLYIMDIGKTGCQQGEITRLTNGLWTDTHCQWSPSGDWIVFSSSRHRKPEDAPSDNGLDPGYFAVFLVKVSDSNVLIRVMESSSNCKGHVNHPFFSPDGKSIVVTADLAAVSVDPISLPHFLHSVRPYGDIFTFDIAMYNFTGVRKFNRITHSRYENSTATWTMFSSQDPHAAWNMRLNNAFTPSCPYAQHDGGVACSVLLFRGRVFGKWSSFALVVINSSQWSSFAFEKGYVGTGFLEVGLKVHVQSSNE